MAYIGLAAKKSVFPRDGTDLTLIVMSLQAGAALLGSAWVPSPGALRACAVQSHLSGNVDLTNAQGAYCYTVYIY